MIVALKSRAQNIVNHNILKFRTFGKNAGNFKIDRKFNPLKINCNSVILSQSRDIYENLAFEDWLYKNLDFTAKGIFILLLWYNGPSVVIGRHQNPWVECSVDFCQATGISIARRNSGGGTVYHDHGNLNFSFFSPRKDYNRKNNLNLICDSITKKWPINLSVSHRDDIICNGKCKHCIKSRATSSTKAKVINLKAVCDDINITDVIKVVTDDYKYIYSVEDVLSFHPNEKLCPGLASIKEKLMSWDWCFGHTPQFTVTKSFPICSTFSKWKGQNLPSDLEIILTSNKGKMENINLNPQILDVEDFNYLHQYLIGSQFLDSINIPLSEWVKESKNKILCKFIKCCIMQMIEDVYR